MNLSRSGVQIIFNRISSDISTFETRFLDLEKTEMESYVLTIAPSFIFTFSDPRCPNFIVIFLYPGFSSFFPLAVFRDSFCTREGSKSSRTFMFYSLRVFFLRCSSTYFLFLDVYLCIYLCKHLIFIY